MACLPLNAAFKPTQQLEQGATAHEVDGGLGAATPGQSGTMAPVPAGPASAAAATVTPAPLNLLLKAYLRVLEYLEGFKDRDGSDIGAHFSRARHPEHYTTTYLPSLDELRSLIVTGKLTDPEDFYSKTLRCFKGVRAATAKDDPRHAQAKSLELALQQFWLKEPALPKLKVITDALLAPLSPSSSNPPQTQTGPPGVIASGSTSYAPAFERMLQQLAGIKNRNGRQIAKTFLALPSKEMEPSFYTILACPRSLQDIYNAVKRGRITDPSVLYAACANIFDDFKAASSTTSVRWRDAVRMREILPTVWNNTAGLPHVSEGPLHTQPNPANAGMPNVGGAVANSPLPSVASGDILASAGRASVLPQSTIPTPESRPASATSRPLPIYPATPYQTNEAILRFLGMPTALLARIARSKNSDEFREIETGAFSATISSHFPMMMLQPEPEPDVVAPEEDCTHVGLPYLLDLKFDEKNAGIRSDPVGLGENSRTRMQWAKEEVAELFKEADPPLTASDEVRYAEELIEYSQERHDMEIILELSATRTLALQAMEIAKGHSPEKTMPGRLEARMLHFYKVFHAKALRLLESAHPQSPSPGTAFFMRGRACAAAILLAIQVSALELALLAMTRDVRQLASVCETGLSILHFFQKVELPPAPAVPEDIQSEPDIWHMPYTTLTRTSQDWPCVERIRQDMYSYNRLAPGARDYLAAHLRHTIAQDGHVPVFRQIILSVLSFYPDDVNFNVILSCCYASIQRYVVQAHVCSQLQKAALQAGEACVEAENNLGVAYLCLNQHSLAQKWFYKTCQARPEVPEAFMNVLYLLDAQASSDTDMGSSSSSSLRFCRTQLKELWEVSRKNIVESGAIDHSGRIPSQMSIRDIAHYQRIHLLSGAFAMRRSDPFKALEHYITGLEAVLSTNTRSADSNSTPRSYTCADLMQGLHAQVQYTWLEQSATSDVQKVCHTFLAAQTKGSLTPEMLRDLGTLRWIKAFPALTSTAAMPHPLANGAVPLCLLAPQRIQHMSTRLFGESDRHPLVMPIAIAARHVDQSFCEGADKDMRNVTAELLLAICQIFEACIDDRDTIVEAAIFERFKIKPSYGALANMYYLVYDLKPTAWPLFNLSVLCTKVRSSYEKTEVRLVSGRASANGSALDFAGAWMRKAQTQPEGARLPAAAVAYVEALCKAESLSRTSGGTQ